ncbi:hypothetical protein, partial [Marinobacter sp. UBA2498]|uniref:hypothetical protein n=1 Tax=Marinobacter sp. UBA2498 TaxID=1946813 RepID=UPI00257D07A9
QISLNRKCGKTSKATYHANNICCLHGYSFLNITPLFSGSLGRAKRRQGCPVEGRQARNELQLLVRASLAQHEKLDQALKAL